MRRSTTSAATDRRRLAALLITELVCALLLLGRPESPPAGPAVATPASHTTPAAPSTSQTLRDGRTARLVGLGGPTAPLLTRISAELDDAAAAVTAFWGADWPRDIVIAAANTDEQFAAVGGGDAPTAATTTGQRIVFAPGAASMSPESLRIVLRHELFHFAARAETAADAPRWLTEGVADFVARPPVPVDVMPTPPTDAELDGPDRSAAYDRAWMFSLFVADRYGADQLRELYRRACGHGHPDAATAVREVLGDDLPLA
jgi:Domain of unknown function (DUF4157)